MSDDRPERCDEKPQQASRPDGDADRRARARALANGNGWSGCGPCSIGTVVS